MGIGISIVLLAIGAVLAFALEVSAPVIRLDAAGFVLMILGATGLLSLVLFWSGPHARSSRRVSGQR